MYVGLMKCYLFSSIDTLNYSKLKFENTIVAKSNDLDVGRTTSVESWKVSKCQM